MHVYTARGDGKKIKKFLQSKKLKKIEIYRKSAARLNEF